MPAQFVRLLPRNLHHPMSACGSHTVRQPGRSPQTRSPVRALPRRCLGGAIGSGRVGGICGGDFALPRRAVGITSPAADGVLTGDATCRSWKCRQEPRVFVDLP